MADRRVRRALAGTYHAPKKLLSAVYQAVFGSGAQPDELIEADLAERFHWTFSELDGQETERVFRAVSLMNVRDCLRRIEAFMDSGGKIKPTERDLSVYKTIIEAANGD